MRSGTVAFFMRAVLFGLLLGGVLLLFALTGPLIGYIDYMGAMRTKHERLQKIAPPRLVIIGGSNAAFGINSTELEAAVGMPVVNMALHASLGYRFMANEVVDHLRKGDVLMIIPEHSLFQSPDKTQDILYSALELYPAAWQYVPVPARTKVGLTYAVKKLQAAGDIIFDPMEIKPEPVYRADGFDERGDLLAHLGRPPNKFATDKQMAVDRIDVDPLFWRITDRLQEAGRERGFTVLLAWTCQARSTVKASIDEGLLEDVRAHGIKAVGTPEQYVYADSLFFDTKYHMGREGREMRTQQLISDLKAAL